MTAARFFVIFVFSDPYPYLYYTFLIYYNGMSRSGQHFICAYNNDDVCEQAFLGSGRQRILLVTEILLVGGRALQ